MSRAERPERGFLLGKFMPPHLGHVFLCDFARHHCRELTILVCSLDDDSIPGGLRHRWMTEMFPGCRVVSCQEALPQAPDEHPDFWPIWRDVVLRYAAPPDAVYASEPYGQRLADELGARFVPVDLPRSAVPVSATSVRTDPFGQWEYIPPPVRPWFVKRVCLFGPESSGKTVLAEALGRRFGTIVVPEYGRTYTHAFGTAVDLDDLRAIAAGHRASVAAAARQANRILIEDTDPILTGVWREMLLGGAEPAGQQPEQPADLYLLTAADFPWVDDGTRYFPAKADRARFSQLCERALTSRQLPFVRLSGPPERRLEEAIAAICACFGLRSPPPG